MNTKQIINTYFQNEASATDYISARLAGDTVSAPPRVSSYHSEEHLADILFSVYCQDEFTKEQKTWFWQILNEQAKTAWNNKNADIFGRSIYLYIRLGKDEADKFCWRNFMDADIFQWKELMDEADIDLYTSALWLLAEWHYKVDWNNQFDAIVKLLSKNENLMRPLNIVFNALGVLDYRQWSLLFLFCDKSDRLRELLQQYLLTCWGLYKDSVKGSLLIESIRKGVKTTIPKKLSKQEIKILKNWLKLDWPETLKGDLDIL